MTSGYRIITLCGSTKFKDEFMSEQKRLTLEGNIVISVGCFGHNGDVITEEQKTMLDDMHKRKIDMADEVFVINVGGYVGKSTAGEIEYAKSTGKPVYYLDALAVQSYEKCSFRASCMKIHKECIDVDKPVCPDFTTREVSGNEHKNMLLGTWDGTSGNL